ncbi:contact-dependent growth inhibition system immunity protein [Streptomyces pathocidini]|uniref:contact-dependent growth inhibition system immunity protein n=1 Tax=Streptomyces pathocidini TaxID=1650571 RepID=UPI003407233F
MSHPRDLAAYERFPALHELLDSYASDGYIFTDTADRPGPALQAYARLAHDSPDRLELVLREIDDLLRIGLFSEEIADDVDLLPHIEPPAGVTVEQCLRVIRDHLVRMGDGEFLVQFTAPETSWEWRARFPELHQLLGAYFHQDFSLDYDSHQEALDDYLSGASTADIRQAADQIRAFLSLIGTDQELGRAAQTLGLEVYPPKGVPLRQWLTDISVLFDRRIEN